jgi:hypothetical protein
MGWESRLPDGVVFNGFTSEGFSLGVSMPIGEDGLWPCVCPDDVDHSFKVAITQNDVCESDMMYCPYCGKHAPTEDFLADQMRRAHAAMEQAATQYMHAEVDKMLRNAFGSHRNRSGSGVTFSFTPGTPPAPQPLPIVEVEPTRRAMRCSECNEYFAVYSLATYCPSCGQLAPAQQFMMLVKVERDRVVSFDLLEHEVRRTFIENGLVATTYESAFKNGFNALETYLKQRFQREATAVVKQPPSTTFQRLDDANALYQTHLSVDLEAVAGPETWQALHRAAAIRHVLTHNAGVIDERFLQRQATWPQVLGQRVIVREKDVLAFLDALDSFAARVIGAPNTGR